MTTKTDEQREAEWNDRIDLSDPIREICERLREICERLGFKNTDVGHIDFTPGETTITVYLNNNHGSKYVDPDTGEVAMQTLTFKTRS
jgi:hypothetical protein